MVSYPEDYRVKISDLVEQWVACQKLDDNDRNIERWINDGYCVCEQLVNRSMLMVDGSMLLAQKQINNDMLSNMKCYMHDISREMGLQQGKTKKNMRAKKLLSFDNLQPNIKKTLAKDMSMCGKKEDAWPEYFYAPKLEAFFIKRF